ncbi:cwf18 pre-mRNA splicing factor-domain-containing protein [Xylariaceae sp. FL0016]|nr:cwf18 pre-mRNA splicing factor-domain-containing protein [Xylariaceae sp. FL0016]
MSTSHAALSAASDDRKARLAKLKTLKRKQPNDEIVAPESTRSPSPPQPSSDTVDISKHVSGRNYDASTRGAKLGFVAPPTLSLEGPTLEEQADAAEKELKARAAEDAKDDKGIDLFKLQPKKPNWDLKRDLDKKMKVLNVRTDNAIARLVRDRIAGAQQAARKDVVMQNSDADGDGEVVGMDGVALVEGLRVREREEEEEERREREDDDMV